MPFPKSFAQVVWGGRFAATGNEDDFSSSIRMTFEGTAQPDFGETLNPEACHALFDELKNIWGNPGLSVRQDATLKFVKINQIGPDGKYTSRNQTNFYEDPNGATGSNTVAYPHQIALASTLTTDVTRGLASKGRIFWPTGATWTRDTAGLSDLQANTIAGGVANWVQTINRFFLDHGSNATAHVMSSEREGAYHRITGIRIGHRFDIQRRRDNAEQETYATAAVALV